ncbi:hypothetical protein [Microbacterium sp. NPDC056569]|uniref:hypothetical protein n=1 Tax=Microbacterium sp. NPDC056569 TaxID=3345867 RepID=UPI00367209E8
MKTMLRSLGALLVVAIVATAATLAVGILAVRGRRGRLFQAFVRFQRDVINPEVLRTAGGAGEQFSVIEHVGRRTGRRYETPVGARAEGDGWRIALVYGAEASWVQNLLASGEGFLRTDGTRRRVDRPQIVPLSAGDLEPDEQRISRALGMTQALHLHDAGEAQAASTGQATQAAPSD